MKKPISKPTQPKKRLSDADRARRKQTFFFLLISILVAVSMLISLIRIV